MQSEERDRHRSLKDLVKLAGAPEPKPKRDPETKAGMASSDSSGFIDLAAIQASDPQWLETALNNAREGAREKARAKAASIAPPIDFEVDDVPVVVPARESKARVVAIGILCAVGMIGIVLAVRAPHSTPADAAAASTASAPHDVTGAPSAAAPVTASPASPGAAGAAAVAEFPADIPPPPAADAPAASEPAVDAKHRGHAHGRAGARAARSVSAGPAAEPTPAAAPSKAGASKLAALAGISGDPPPAAVPPAVVPPPAAPPVGGALGAAMKSAADTGSPAPAPKHAAAEAAPPPTLAERASGSVPDRPSPAVVTSALKAALPGAKECVENDDGPSRVSVTFGSSGAVTSVQVTGPATPKEQSCLKSAVGKTKLPPFSQPSYTAAFSVRPN